MAGRLHNYTRHTPGVHYVIDPARETPDNNHFYMTADGRGIRPGDYIQLQGDTGPVKYQVEQIDYYCDTPHYWMALLVKCPD